MYTTAIVIPEAEKIELREVALTEPGPEDVTVQTVYTSISAGTERMLLAGRMPHPMLQFPVVPGYETVGRVASVGRDAPGDLVGQWVYVGGARCYANVNPAWGGQAASLHVDYRRVVPLGAIPAEQGVLLALGATALHGIDLLQTALHGTFAGKRVLVLGQGPVGQIAARLLHSAEAEVAVTDKIPSRLAHSVATKVVDATQASTFEPGSYDAIIEATGSMAALTGALPALANNGTILLLGYYDKLELPYMPLFLKQAQLLTAREWGPNDLARIRDMLAAGTLDVASLITHRMPIDQVQESYQVALGSPDCLKLVLNWEHSEFRIQNPE